MSLSINVSYVRPMPLGGVVEIEAEVGVGIGRKDGCLPVS